MSDPQNNTPLETPAPLERLISLCMHKRVLVYLLTLALVVWGILAAPFDTSPAGLFRSPVPVDAIPDIGENQQIIFTDWDGRSATGC